jgi:hypothetical protein
LEILNYETIPSFPPPRLLLRLPHALLLYWCRADQDDRLLYISLNRAIFWSVLGCYNCYCMFQVSTVYLHYYRSSRHIVFMCRLIALEVMVYYLQNYKLNFLINWDSGSIDVHRPLQTFPATNQKRWDSYIVWTDGEPHEENHTCQTL